MRMLKIRLPGLKVVNLVLLFLGCLWPCIAGSESLAFKELRVGYVPVFSQLPVVVSYEQWKLDVQAVRVRLQRFQSYTALEAAFRADAIDIAYLPLPAVLQMKRDGLAVSIAGALHHGGSSLVISRKIKDTDSKDMIIGVPGLASGEHLLLEIMDDNETLVERGFVPLGLQLNGGLEAILKKRVDGLLLPEPYSSIVASNLPSDEFMYTAVALNEQEIPMAVLAVRNRLLIDSHEQLVIDYLASLVAACRLIEEDITVFGAEQTAITQQPYFGFSREEVLRALTTSPAKLSFGYWQVSMEQLNSTLERMVVMKLLIPGSMETEDLLLQDLSLSVQQ